jgi:CheY-like chemotaxis protein
VNVNPTEMQHVVFIADDDKDDFDILKSAFDEVGCAREIQYYPNGTALYDALLNLPPAGLPDLVILDHQLPGRSGSEIVAQIRSQSHFNSISLAIYSTAVAPGKIKELQQNGVDLCLIKGASLSHIIEQVKAFCLIAEQRKIKGGTAL